MMCICDAHKCDRESIPGPPGTPGPPGVQGAASPNNLICPNFRTILVSTNNLLTIDVNLCIFFNLVVFKPGPTNVTVTTTTILSSGTMFIVRLDHIQTPGTTVTLGGGTLAGTVTLSEVGQYVFLYWTGTQFIILKS